MQPISATGPPDSGPDISFVIISLNDAAKLVRAVSSAALASRASGMSFQILVVDNGSTDHTQPVLRRLATVLGSSLRVFTLPRNTGTTFPRNLAMREARGRLVCVMDSDAEILDPGFREAGSLFLSFPQVGLLAPRILLPGGEVYDSVKLLPTLPDKLMKLPGILLGRKTANRDWYPDFPFDRPRTAHTAISCCWIFPRSTWERVGPLDERIFYAPEDVDWSLRVWKAGLAVVHYPYLRVMHHTRQISHNSPFSVTARSHFLGLLYYYAKHRHLWGRGRVARRFIDPLAHRLDPSLGRWRPGPQAE